MLLGRASAITRRGSASASSPLIWSSSAVCDRFKARVYLGFASRIPWTQALASRPRIPAARLRRSAGNRRPHLCGLLAVATLITNLLACGDPLGQGPARSRERARIRAESAIWSHRRHDQRTAPADPDAPRLDTGFRLFQRWRVRRASVRAASGGRSASGLCALAGTGSASCRRVITRATMRPPLPPQRRLNCCYLVTVAAGVFRGGRIPFLWRACTSGGV